MNVKDELIDRLIDLSFAEDIGDGDHTTLSTIPADAMGKNMLLIKEDGVLAGVDMALRIFHRFDPTLQVEVLIKDGDTVCGVICQDEKDGRYYASILVDTGIAALPKKPIERETTIGIDTGLKTFAVCSNGEEFATPHFQRQQKRKLKLLSRQLSRKEKGSRAFNRTKLRIARVHSKIARQRLDYQHKITHRLTHENQVGTICVEDLNVRGMVRNKHLAYDISDAAIGEFYRQLKYKCEWYGVNYIEVGRFEPTSKTCSVCGWKYKELKLHQRSWVCPECGARHDRDINASVNIREFGLKALRMERAEVKPVECPLVDDRPSGPKKQRLCEAGKVRRKHSPEAAESSVQR